MIVIYNGDNRTNNINIDNIYSFKIYRKNSIVKSYSLESNYPAQYKQMLQNYLYYITNGNNQQAKTIKAMYDQYGVSDEIQKLNLQMINENQKYYILRSIFLILKKYFDKFSDASTNQ